MSSILYITMFITYIAIIRYFQIKMQNDKLKLAMENNLMVNFECSNCHKISTVGYDVAQSIIKVSPKQSKLLKQRKIFCESCNNLEWHCIENPFIGKECQTSYKKITLIFILKLYFISLIYAIILIFIGKKL